MNDKYQQQLQKWEQQEILNKRLEHAALEGDLETVIALTTATKSSEAAEIDYNDNYPLMGACFNGHLPVVEFLLSHPNAKKRARVSKKEYITDAIDAAIEYGQHHIIAFFKSKYSEIFSKYMAPANVQRIEQNLDSLTMKGELDTIELLMKEKSPTISPSYVPMLMGKSLQYNHPKVFKYWFSYVSEASEKLSNPKRAHPVLTYEESKSLVHTALFHKKTAELKLMVDKFKLNLTELIDTQTFRIIIQRAPESLYHIVQEIDYRPSEQLWGQITTYFETLPSSDEYYDNFSKFINLVQIKQEKEKLLEQIAAPVYQIGTTKAPKRIENKTHKI